MRNLWKWALGFIGVGLVTFVVALLFLGGFGRMGYGFSCGGFGMSGAQFGGMMGMPFRAGMGGWGLLGGLTMLGMLLIPLGLLALLVLGVVVLARGLNAPKAVVATGSACPSCGRPVQGEWGTCPYCGKPLR